MMGVVVAVAEPTEELEDDELEEPAVSLEELDPPPLQPATSAARSNPVRIR
jgi:hypothetical protein